MKITGYLVLAMYGFDISSFAGELLYSVASILRGGRTASQYLEDIDLIDGKNSSSSS